MPVLRPSNQEIRTSGHSNRVAIDHPLAEAAHQLDSGPFGSLRFHDQMNEIRYASLLRFWKIGVRADFSQIKKLYPEEQAVMDRFRMIRQGIELEMTKKQLEYFLGGVQGRRLGEIRESFQN